MNFLLEIFSWLAVVALTFTAVPQIILNFKRKSTEGASWLTFGLVLFGMIILFFRSLFTVSDLIIQLNYGLGSFIMLIANIQFFYYRCLKKN